MTPPKAPQLSQGLGFKDRLVTFWIYDNAFKLAEGETETVDLFLGINSSLLKFNAGNEHRFKSFSFNLLY